MNRKSKKGNVTTPISDPIDDIPNKKLTLTYQQLFGYTIFLVTFGASIFTFFKAIPKLDALDDKVSKLEIDVGVLREIMKYIQEDLKK